MSRRRERAQGGTFAHLTRSRAQRGRERPGGCRRPAAGEPVDDGGQSSRRARNAARRAEAERRRHRAAGAVGRARPVVAGRRPADARRGAVGRRGPAHRRRARELLVVSTDSRSGSARGTRRELVPHVNRSLRAGRIGETWRRAVASGRQASAVAARDVRFDRSAANAGGDGSVSQRLVGRRIRARRRSLAGFASLRRAVGTALARCGALRRHEGLHAVSRRQLSLVVYLSRLRGAIAERRFAVRSVRRRAVSRRPVAARSRPTLAGGTRLSDARQRVHEQPARRDRRSHRRRHARPAGAHRGVRAVPRPQIRSDSDARLLFTVRRLRQLRRADGAAALRRSTGHARVCRVRHRVG